MKLNKLTKLNLITLSSTVICSIILMQFTCAQNRITKKLSKSASNKIIFFDDFSGPVLDRSKWNIRITGETVNNEQQAYVDSAATIYIAKGNKAAGATMAHWLYNHVSRQALLLKKVKSLILFPVELIPAVR